MIQWHEVTWYSKLGAIILFIGVVPALSFYIGTQYQLTKDVLSTTSETDSSGHVAIEKAEEKNFFYAPTASDEQEWDLSEQFRSSSHIFYCLSKSGTESSCWVYASKLDGSDRQWLQIQLDAGSNETGLLLSPDKKNVLVIRETKAIVINADTLVQTEIAKAENKTEFGTYTGFPSFVPAGRWVDSNTIELGVFDTGAVEGYSYLDADGKTIVVPDPTPLEKKLVKLN